MTSLRLMAGLLLLVVCSGCAVEHLERAYGRHRVPGAAGSVNGTDVFAAMFEDAGHEVYFRRTLVTSHMKAADIVVWFPDDRLAPSQKVCNWFEEWLSEEPDRTLIVVGRDFDAEPQYWEFHFSQQASGKPSNERGEASRRQGKDQPPSRQRSPDKGGAKKNGDSDETQTHECPWFVYESGDKTTIRDLSGPGARNVEASQTRIELQTRLVPKKHTEVLLNSEAGPLVSRMTTPAWNGGQIVFVANGSFLLNLTLINHEHRKLAGKLVAAVGRNAKVVFLESREGGPPIDPPPTDSSLWTLFKGWPLGPILLQLAVAGTIFCFARWPIFGRAKQPPSPPMTDFSAHVAAVGELLTKTRSQPPAGAPPGSPLCDT